MKYLPFVLWLALYPAADSFSLYIYFKIHQVMQAPFTQNDVAISSLISTLFYIWIAIALWKKAGKL